MRSFSNTPLDLASDLILMFALNSLFIATFQAAKSRAECRARVTLEDEVLQLIVVL